MYTVKFLDLAFEQGGLCPQHLVAQQVINLSNIHSLHNSSTFKLNPQSNALCEISCLQYNDIQL